MENENKKRGRPKKQKNMNSPLARRLHELSGTMTHQEIADGVGISRQTIGQFLLGNTHPDTETLCKLADFFKVSTDYLLGRTDVKSADTTLQDICKYTGLDEKSINILLAYKEIQEYTKNKDVPSKYSLVDTLNFILAEFGEDSDLIFSLTNALNYNNSGFNSDDDEDVRDEFNRIFPNASKWLEGKGEIYGRDENFTLLKSRLERQFGFMAASILCLYNPTELEKKFEKKPFRDGGNIFQLLKSEKEYHSHQNSKD